MLFGRTVTAQEAYSRFGLCVLFLSIFLLSSRLSISPFLSIAISFCATFLSETISELIIGFDAYLVSVSLSLSRRRHSNYPWIRETEYEIGLPGGRTNHRQSSSLS